MILSDNAGQGSAYHEPTLSRDGTRLAFTDASNPPRLWLRLMDQLEAHPILGAEAVTSSAFSPDGQWIAFLNGRTPVQLKKIPVTGGTSITLCDVPVP